MSQSNNIWKCFWFPSQRYDLLAEEQAKYNAFICSANWKDCKMQTPGTFAGPRTTGCPQQVPELCSQQVCLYSLCVVIWAAKVEQLFPPVSLQSQLMRTASGTWTETTPFILASTATFPTSAVETAIVDTAAWTSGIASRSGSKTAAEHLGKNMAETQRAAGNREKLGNVQ